MRKISLKKKEVAELLIDGNHIEFYSRFGEPVFPSTFIGSDGRYQYKVFAKGAAKPSNNRLLEYTSSHRVFYVLMQNFGFSKGLDISGIIEFSFVIPEIINWLGIGTVYYGSTDKEELAAGEKHLESITIHSENPKVELYFESKTFNSIIEHDDSTTITIKKEPRIRVVYDQTKDIQTVMNDIECLMQFFGLLIGTVSTADDIRLSIEGQESKCWLFINCDYSYNTTALNSLDRPRTYLYVVEDMLVNYYSHWRTFFYDDSYSLLRRIYFFSNGKKEIFAEDIFVQYMRILDGYHTRISGDEETKKKLKKALKFSTKKIKEMIFTDDGKPLFEDAIKKVIPDWKYNSSNMEDIAGWIASGYIARTPLSHRLQELDSQYLSIIENNGADIEKATRNSKKIEGKSDEELTKIYFRELGDTRNYYSHYKLDDTGVLEFTQLTNSINVLKATIITIFFTHMGMDKELIRRIMAFDSELHFQTMFLRNENDRVFQYPSQIESKETVNKKRKWCRFVNSKMVQLVKKNNKKRD